MCTFFVAIPTSRKRPFCFSCCCFIFFRCRTPHVCSLKPVWVNAVIFNPPHPEVRVKMEFGFSFDGLVCIDRLGRLGIKKWRIQSGVAGEILVQINKWGCGLSSCGWELDKRERHALNPNRILIISVCAVQQLPLFEVGIVGYSKR